MDSTIDYRESHCDCGKRLGMQPGISEAFIFTTILFKLAILETLDLI